MNSSMFSSRSWHFCVLLDHVNHHSNHHGSNSRSDPRKKTAEKDRHPEICIHYLTITIWSRNILYQLHQSKLAIQDNNVSSSYQSIHPSQEQLPLAEQCSWEYWNSSLLRGYAGSWHPDANWKKKGLWKDDWSLYNIMFVYMCIISYAVMSDHIIPITSYHIPLYSILYHVIWYLLWNCIYNTWKEIRGAGSPAQSVSNWSSSGTTIWLRYLGSS